MEIEEVERLIASQFQNGIDCKTDTQISTEVSLFGGHRVSTQDKGDSSNTEVEVEVEVEGMGREEVANGNREGKGEGKGKGEEGSSLNKEEKKEDEKPVSRKLLKNPVLVRRVKERMAVVAAPDADKRSHHLILIVEHSMARTLDLYTPIDVKKFLQGKVHSTYMPMLVLFVDEIPRTTTGKLDRQAFKEMSLSFISEAVDVGGNVDVDDCKGDGGTREEGSDKKNVFSGAAGREKGEERGGGEGDTDTTGDDRTSPYSSSSTFFKSPDIGNKLVDSVNRRTSHEDIQTMEFLRRKIVEVFFEALPLLHNMKSVHSTTPTDSTELDASASESEIVTAVQDKRNIRNINLVNKHDNKTQNTKNGQKEFKEVKNENKSNTLSDDIYDHDFFSMGGDSMTAVQVLWKLNKMVKDVQKECNLNNEIICQNSIRDELQLEIISLTLPIEKLATRIFANLRRIGKSTEIDAENRYLDDDSEVGINGNNLSKSGDANMLKKRKYLQEILIQDSTSTNSKISGIIQKRSKESNATASTPIYCTSFTGPKIAPDKNLYKVLVYGRTDKWEWSPGPKGSKSKNEDENNSSQHSPMDPGTATECPTNSNCLIGESEGRNVVPDRLGGLERSRENSVDGLQHSVAIEQTWTSPMKKCIDSSPLVIVRHYQVNKEKDKNRGDEIDGKDRREDNIQESREVEVQGPVSVVYIGSHGGDFSAVCADTGKVIWTVDLESRFYTTSECTSMLESNPGSTKSFENRIGEKEKEKESISDRDVQASSEEGLGRNRATQQGIGAKRTGRVRVHVEGSASCNVTGSVLYVGCFRGEDVDGPEIRLDERESGECVRLQNERLLQFFHKLIYSI